MLYIMGERMAKLHIPETPEGRIAQIIELRAGKGWGPETLSNDSLAGALNIDPSLVTDEEWADIYEFSVNAGAEAQQVMTNKRLPENITEKKETKLNKRTIDNKDRFDPTHDIFHAAEMYYETHTAESAMPFTKVDKRERYLHPGLYRTELWPILFYSMPGTKQPLAVKLATPEGRAELAEHFAAEIRIEKNPIRGHIRRLLEAPQPLEPGEAQREYQKLVELVLIANSADKTPDATEDEVNGLADGIDATLENLPEHYDVFAKRVFSGEWKENPRLFLDEFLAAIRTQPVQEAAQNPDTVG